MMKVETWRIFCSPRVLTLTFLRSFPTYLSVNAHKTYENGRKVILPNRNNTRRERMWTVSCHNVFDLHIGMGFGPFSKHNWMNPKKMMIIFRTGHKSEANFKGLFLRIKEKIDLFADVRTNLCTTSYSSYYPELSWVWEVRNKNIFWFFERGISSLFIELEKI
jgi:hypothetical protein